MIDIVLYVVERMLGLLSQNISEAGPPGRWPTDYWCMATLLVQGLPSILSHRAGKRLRFPLSEFLGSCSLTGLLLVKEEGGRLR